MTKLPRVETLKIISKQTFWQIIGKVVTSTSTFIILAVVARSYYEQGVGIFTLSLTYLAMFNLLSDFGFNAHELRKGNFVWQKLVGTRLVWSVILVILAVGSLPFLPFGNDFAKSVIFGVLGIFGSAVFASCNLIFQKKLRYDLSVLASSLGIIIGLIFYLSLSALKLPVAYLLIANSLTWAVIALSSLALIKKFLPSFMPIYDQRYTINLFKDCWPIAVTLALNVVYFRADAFMLSFYKGLSEAGVYNLAYSIFQAVLVLPTFMMNAYYPLMLKSLHRIKLIGILLLGLAILGTVITLLLAPSLIKILAGSGFPGSDQSLQILSFSFPAFFLSSLLMWLLLSKGQYKKMLLIYTVGLIFNLLLNFIYIPQFSYLAASWITVISEYLILLMLTCSLLV